jgi:anti-anti-sigma factor
MHVMETGPVLGKTVVAGQELGVVPGVEHLTCHGDGGICPWTASDGSASDKERTAIAPMDGTPWLDPDGTEKARVAERIRSGDETVGGVRSVCDAEELVCFTIEEPAPEVLVVRVAGELDLLTSPLLDQHLLSQIVKGRGHLVVDFSAVDFFGAVGLGSIVAAGEAALRRGVRLHLTGAHNRVVGRVLEITNLHTTFDIQPTVESVVDSLDGSRAD